MSTTQISAEDYAKFVKYQESQANKLLASKRWNARLRLLAKKAVEAGFVATDEEVEAWIASGKEINL